MHYNKFVVVYIFKKIVKIIKQFVKVPCSPTINTI